MALSLSEELVRGIQIDREKMRAAIDPELYATDAAIERVVEEGIPFRESYRIPIEQQELDDRSPEASLCARVSVGSCGNLRLDLLRQRLDGLSQ